MFSFTKPTRGILLSLLLQSITTVNILKLKSFVWKLFIINDTSESTSICIPFEKQGSRGSIILVKIPNSTALSRQKVSFKIVRREKKK